MIEVRALTKRFGKLEAVRGIDLDVGPGEIFGFLGPNGAGKSTTISMLCTLVKPTSGSARVAGFDVAAAASHVRARIGLVFQDPSLDEQLTAYENLQLHAFIYDLPPAVYRSRIAEVLRIVELEDRARSLVKTFSGGMRRRLEIGRGIMHFPQVLFLDEPTLGLDPQTRDHIWSYLKVLRAELGITVFMTTHYMDEAELCDRVAIIDAGRIVALGTPEELKRRVGGDVVDLRTGDNAAAQREIQQLFGILPRSDDGTLRMEVPDGQEFVPRLIREIHQPVKTVALREPSLDDVFIKLTGRGIRDQEATQLDRMRRFRQARR